MLESVFAAPAVKAASSVAVSGLKFVANKVFDREGRAEREVIASACIRAIDASRPQNEEADEQPWTRAGKRSLALLADKDVASRVLTAVTARPDDLDAIRVALDQALQEPEPRRSRLGGWWKRRRDRRRERGGDCIDKLATQLGFDADQFLLLFPATVLEELVTAAAKQDSPLLARAQLASQRQIVGRLSADQVPALSPADLKVQLIRFLTAEEDWNRKQLAKRPYMPRHTDPTALGIESMCRICARHGHADADGTADGRASESPMPVSALLAAQPRVVLLADAGMGKTWLIHTYAATLARRAREQLEATTLRAGDIIIPATMRCTSLEQRDIRDLAEAAANELADRHRLALALRHWLTGHFRSHACVFLLDALDEAVPAQREHVLDMVADRTLDPGRVRVVLTSRKASYQGLRGTADFIEAELQPLRPADVRSYVQAWGLDNDESLLPSGQGPLAAMSRIPLLLALLCHLGHWVGQLPENQATIYARVIRRFLRSEHHDIPADRPHDPFAGEPAEREQRLLRILYPLAFAFASAAQGWAQQLSSSEILQVLRTDSTLLPNNVDAPRALAELSVRAGILVPAEDARDGADPPYMFLHRGFAEYLVAEHLAGDRRRLHQFIDDRGWIAPDWARVWVLLGPLCSDPAGVLDRLLTLDVDPLSQALYAAAAFSTEIQPTAHPGVQDRIDDIARRLVALLHTPARFEAAERLTAIAYRLPQDVEGALLTLIGRRRDDLYLDTPGGYGVPLEREAEWQQLVSARVAAIRAVAGMPGDTVDEVLVDALDDRAVGVRAAAVDVLQQRAGNAATDYLLDAMQHERFDNKHLAAEALGARPGDAVTAALLSALRDASDLLREYAAEALKDRPGEAVTDALMSALRGESDERVAGYIVAALQDRPGQHVTDLLLDTAASVHARHDLRLTAACTLRARPEPGVTGSLLAALQNSTDPETRWYLLRALATRPGEDVTNALLTALASDKDVHGRHVQARELRDRPGPEVTTALRAALRDPAMTVRRSAAEALTERLEPVVTDALLDALDDDEGDVRKAAVEALPGRGDPRITAKLVYALDDADSEVAAAAAQALSGQQTRQVTDALITALNPDSRAQPASDFALTRRPAVRCAAAAALAAHHEQSVTDALLIAAADGDHGVRGIAIAALRGRRGDAVTAAMLTALSDRERSVQAAAVQSLRDRTGPEITRWLKSHADASTTDPGLLYTVAFNASQLWATWPPENRKKLLRALMAVTQSVSAKPTSAGG